MINIPQPYLEPYLQTSQNPDQNTVESQTYGSSIEIKKSQFKLICIVDWKYVVMVAIFDTYNN